MKKKVHMFIMAICVIAAIVTFVACESRSSAHTHTMTHHAAKAATCTEDGNVEYWVCDTCGKYYSDKNGKTKIADTTSVILPASHDYIEHEGKNATCTEDGYAAYRTCSRCDYTTYEKIPAGHDYDDNYVCKQCGYTLHETKDLNYALNSDKKSYSVIGMGTATGTDIVIAPVYEKLPVTSIGEYAFRNCSSLISITIPNSVTSIGRGAFSDCSSLTSITIPNSVTSIGDRAFSYCSSLTSITIPNGVTTIGYRAFYECSSLTGIMIPNSVTSIGDSAFWCCSNLTSITIPNSVTAIGSVAFSNTAFYNNEANWKNGVLYIGKHLIDVKDTISGAYTIDRGTITIANSAFFSCHSVTSITIPNSVTSIGQYAFQHCWSLTSITIPNSVTSMGNEVFSYCGNLTSITFNGTKSQWNAIAKGDGWADGIEDFTVHCTNGDLAKSEAGV